MSFYSKKMKVDEGSYDIHANDVLEQYEVTREQLIADGNKGLRYLINKKGAFFQKEQIDKFYTKKKENESHEVCPTCGEHVDMLPSCYCKLGEQVTEG